MKWRRGSLLVAALAMVVLALSLTDAIGSAAPGPRPDQYTPLVQSVMSTPRWFTDTGGRVHLVYELELINGFPVAVNLRSVAVRDVRRGRTLETLTGSSLRASMTLLASPGSPSTKVPPSGIGVVWFDVVLASRGALPRSIQHTITVTVPRGLPVSRTITYTGAVAQVDLRPPVVLGPPLRGPGWIALGSCCDGPHRRSIQPINGHLYLGQRLAIDWNGFDSKHRFVVGNPDVTTNWIFYGKPVLAVADATVVTAVDRFPDQIPNHPKPVTIDEADGNHVILALGHGRYAFYAHLKPGSIRVKPGDRVRRGEVIAELGNSGSSSGPHLHFQVMNRPSALASDGLPFVFADFRYAGQIPPLDAALEAEINAGKAIPVRGAGAGPRHAEFPLGRDVINFGPG